MDPKKVSAIKEWEAPTNARGVRSFIGFANFYRDFIDSFSEIVAPLIKLTKKGEPWKWEDKQQEAFDKLEQSFISAPVLAQWDPDRPTVVEPDCSGWALGACLSQEGSDEKLRPVAYLSKTLTPTEVNYEIHDKELLAVVRALEEWRAELTGLKDPFLVLSDHKNLEYFMSTRQLSERQVRWAEFLSRFRFTLKHRPGKLSLRPDALSRREQDIPQDGTDERLRGRHQQVIKPEWILVSQIDPQGYAIGQV